MALQLGALRAALLDAGASPEKAERAAEEMASYEREFAAVKGDLLVLKWMVGTVLAVVLGVLWKVVTLHG